MDGVLREAAENVDIIADSGILKSSSPSRGQLRDCIMALEAKLVADAALARRPPKTKLANVVGALDDDVIAELGAALKRAPVA